MYNESEDHKHLYKSLFFFKLNPSSYYLVVLIGDAGVGKTHILSR